MNAPAFWDDQASARAVVAELKRLKASIEPVEAMRREVDDVRALYELASEEEGAARDELLAEADQTLSRLEQRGEQVELQALLSEPNDARNAFMTITAGAGGTEAQDWCEMLFRMYLYYFGRAGFKVEETDRQEGEQAGLKYVALHVVGPYAFG